MTKKNTDQMSKPIADSEELSRAIEQPKMWRAVEHAGQDALPQYRDEFVERPRNVLAQNPSEGSPLSPEIPPVDRRNFMGLVGAGLGLASVTLTGCVRKPQDKIMPYVRRPEDLIPGNPRYYATVAQVTGSVMGLLVESQEGRPTKIDGNPRHPNSMGATDVFTQGAVADIYDATRIKQARVARKDIKLNVLDKRLDTLAAGLTNTQGEGLALLLRDVRSPTLREMLAELKRVLPKARIYRHDAAYPQNALAGASMVGMDKHRVVYDFSRADRVLAIDSDFMGMEGDAIRNARRYSWRRRISKHSDSMNRLYAVEPYFSVTGMNADHRLRLSASECGEFLADLYGHLISTGFSGATGAASELAPIVNAYKSRQSSLGYRKFLAAVAKDLVLNKRRSLIVVGERQPARVHAIAHVLNNMLEAYGNSVFLYPSDEMAADGNIVDLAKAISASQVKTLFMIGGNPVYDAPADLGFGKLVKSVALSVAVSVSESETVAAAKWVVPMSHFLEAWGDLQAADGTYGIAQPLIAPLYPSYSSIELIAALIRKRQTGYELVRKYWRARTTASTALFEHQWRQTLHDGVRRSVVKPAAVTLSKLAGVATAWAKRATPLGDGQLELVFALDPKNYDGRFAQNAWLQELPDPVTKLTWDNALLVGVATAKRQKLENGQLVEVQSGARKLKLPVWITPGIADRTIVIQLGYGRENSGKVAKGVGFNANVLRSVAAPDFTRDVNISTAVRGSYKLASTQMHGTMVEPMTGIKREIAVEATLEDYAKFEKARLHKAAAHGDHKHDHKHAHGDHKKGHGEGHDKKGHGGGGHGHVEDRNFAQKKAQLLPNHKLKSIYAESNVRTGQQWGMSIDLSTCIGCNACTIACQAENNIPTVGKDEVMNGRELHWIRLDRYFVANKYDKKKGRTEHDPKGYKEGDVAHDDVQVINQPVGCMQCETAPCENVCPVGATAHSPEGLNDMAYNRCIGTRYCGNNCPYKVRRFNFYNYTKRQDQANPMAAMQRNPDVTVRFRGVMEKCTYCVQRINQARIAAKVASADGHGNGTVPEGAITTACQQVCPTQSIVFGDVSDPKSAVSKLKLQTRDYGVLADLNTKPRTTYLAKIRNPNSELS
jgi:Fe-S-cluster-containing dehydrogenase component